MSSGGGMTIRERVGAALRRQPVDQIPVMFGVPGGEDGERLRALGSGRWSWVHTVSTETPNVSMDTVEYEAEGLRYRRTTAKTPVGEVYATWRLDAAYGSDWYVDHYIKGPDDYRAVEFLVRDTVYSPAYDAVRDEMERSGEEGWVTSGVGFSPLLEMEINLMGLERFGQDMIDRPDLFFSLYEVLSKKHREELFPLLANTPAEHVTYCGNCVPEVLGHSFERYCVPLYDELAAMVHERGKILGCHLDANNGFWAKTVGGSRLDVIEAFTPAPDTDMSMADARRAWPNKALWLNFPSSVHLQPLERVTEVTRQLAAEAGSKTGVVMGITEDIPASVGNRTLIAIAETLAEMN